MQFHLDEHVDPVIAQGLRSRGIDVTTTVDANLVSASDELHLDFAEREGRVISTNDADFLRLASATSEHAGIAYCARRVRSIGHIVRHLCLMHDCMEAHEMLVLCHWLNLGLATTQPGTGI
jgi:predicted nuclease of predicted toxin-antitoxin system